MYYFVSELAFILSFSKDLFYSLLFIQHYTLSEIYHINKKVNKDREGSPHWFPMKTDNERYWRYLSWVKDKFQLQRLSTHHLNIFI